MINVFGLDERLAILSEKLRVKTGADDLVVSKIQNAYEQHVLVEVAEEVDGAASLLGEITVYIGDIQFLSYKQTVVCDAVYNNWPKDWQDRINRH